MGRWSGVWHTRGTVEGEESHLDVNQVFHKVVRKELSESVRHKGVPCRVQRVGQRFVNRKNVLAE
jgi:hypothetical protein